MTSSKVRVMRQTPNINIRTDMEVIEEWIPPSAPHCSNCFHCKVGEDSFGLTVSCAKGYDNGLPKPLLGMIRQHNPRGFKDAHKCPDFTSMSSRGRPRNRD